jgi:hypothetical protein
MPRFIFRFLIAPPHTINTVEEHSTRNLRGIGSNPATGAGKERMLKFIFSFLIAWSHPISTVEERSPLNLRGIGSNPATGALKEKMLFFQFFDCMVTPNKYSGRKLNS